MMVGIEEIVPSWPTSRKKHGREKAHTERPLAFLGNLIPLRLNSLQETLNLVTVSRHFFWALVDGNVIKKRGRE